MGAKAESNPYIVRTVCPACEAAADLPSYLAGSRIACEACGEEYMATPWREPEPPLPPSLWRRLGRFVRPLLPPESHAWAVIVTAVLLGISFAIWTTPGYWAHAALLGSVGIGSWSLARWIHPVLRWSFVAVAVIGTGLAFEWGGTYVVRDDVPGGVIIDRYARWGDVPLWREVRGEGLYASGALTPSGRAHGRWYFFGRKPGLSEHIWFWRGEEVSQAEYQRRGGE